MLGSECFLLSLVAPRCKKEREEDPIIDKNVGRDGREWGGGVVKTHATAATLLPT